VNRSMGSTFSALATAMNSTDVPAPLAGPEPPHERTRAFQRGGEILEGPPRLGYPFARLVAALRKYCAKADRSAYAAHMLI
jgi:hypothetical protein